MPGMKKAWTLDELMDLPWTWQGPREVRDDGTHWEIQVAELPDFFVAGESYDEVLRELPTALRAFLASYLDRGETPPIPKHPEWWRVMKVWSPAHAAAAQRLSEVPGTQLGIPGDLVTAGSS
jgi:predicted RNase H-like HicB family nuclease